MRRAISCLLCVLAALLGAATAQAQSSVWSHLGDLPGDKLLMNYFRAETARIGDGGLARFRTLEAWEARRPELHRQLREMLGLDPWPERTPLAATVTGTVKHDEFIIEKLHFQSRPGLYVTGNLYVPRNIEGRAPAVLYVCGHARVKENGVSYGGKAHYQHHGIWFARHGYVCLVIDTLQLGEIEGTHHGTHHEGLWWWNARGYVPAGVEAWNCVRALDYLQTRPEVDPERLGVTGRSGGGAYSWWIAALDERIKAAVPTAGIVPLESHVVEGCVEGHCDCMYMLNTYRWDYGMLAALIAPRALLLSNTDKDRIFPVEGVERIHRETRRIYQLYGAGEKFGLQISEGPHEDIPELQVAAFRWMDRFLKQQDPRKYGDVESLFEPRDLKVFETLPQDELNTRIHETFVAAAEPRLPKDAGDWQRLKAGWLAALREKSFRGWPETSGSLNLRPAGGLERDGLRLTAYDFESQPHVPLRLYVASRADLTQPDLAVLHVIDEAEWPRWSARMRIAFVPEQVGPDQGGAKETNALGLTQDAALPEDQAGADSFRQMLGQQPWAFAFVAPRGIGPTAWNPDVKRDTQIRRRFMLLGQTVDGMRAWDIRRAVQAARTVPGIASAPLWLEANGVMAGNALYASLFEPDIARLDLWRLPASHRDGPNLLNVQRYLDLPQALTMAAERSRVVLYQDAPAPWPYPAEVSQRLGWNAKQIQWRKDPSVAAPETR